MYNHISSLLSAVMPIYMHQVGANRIIKSSPVCPKSCLTTRISLLQAGNSERFQKTLS